mgnify:CR=1 FL=1|jgi:hypothetical protein
MINIPSTKAFFVSTGRTGTHFIEKFFNSHFDNICAYHEPQPSRHLRILSNLYYSGVVTDGMLSSVYLMSRKRLFNRISCDIYIEANPFLYGFANSLIQTFPNSIIFHIVRDPRSYIESQINFGSFRGIKGLVENFLPFWFTCKPSAYKKLEGYNWRNMSDIEKVAWRWYVINYELSEFGKNNKNYYLLRYEDVFNSRRDGLKKILNILDLTMNEKQIITYSTGRVRVSKLNVISNWKKWDKKDLESAVNICRPLMDLYGYLP